MEREANQGRAFLNIGIPGVNPPRILTIVTMFAPQPNIIKKYESEIGEEIVVEYKYQFTFPIKRESNEMPLGIHVYKNETEPYELITLKLGLTNNN